ncbi:hypothetical protein B7P43_G18220 [Cryptotermes secundus]|uniref:Uncharacterized protein n=1 Tax=Cryptotermes secundus TaxID=105785 RepID=A0A2J7QSP1_9NEOP|nr:hypothetical protein B7P43_G18220 [Cryptotermes secundus]
MHSVPSSPWHSSAVNSARTSTAFDLHAGPQFAPTGQVIQKTAMFKAQRNV